MAGASVPRRARLQQQARTREVAPTQNGAEQTAVAAAVAAAAAISAQNVATAASQRVARKGPVPAVAPARARTPVAHTLAPAALVMCGNANAMNLNPAPEALDDCAAAQLVYRPGQPLNALAAACKVMRTGLKLGLDISVTGVSHVNANAMSMAGKVDLSKWLGAGAEFDFELGPGRVRFAGPKTGTTVGAVIARIVKGSAGVPLAFARPLLDVVFTRPEIVVQLEPYAVKIAGDAGGFNFAVVFATKPLAFGVAVTAPGATANALVRKMFSGIGLGAVMNNVIDVKSLSASLASGSIGAAGLGVGAMEQGLTLRMLANFNRYSPYTAIKWLGTNLPDVQATASISLSSFTVSLGFPLIKLNDKLSLEDYQVSLEASFPMGQAASLVDSLREPAADAASSASSASSEGESKSAKPSLTFSCGSKLRWKVGGGHSDLVFEVEASVELIVPTFTLALSMAGMWDNALGVPGLSIGDLTASVSVSAPPPHLSAIALGGTLTLRPRAGGPTIMGKLYASVDIQDPLKNWYYASVDQMTGAPRMRIHTYT